MNFWVLFRVVRVFLYDKTPTICRRGAVRSVQQTEGSPYRHGADEIGRTQTLPSVQAGRANQLPVHYYEALLGNPDGIFPSSLPSSFNSKSHSALLACADKATAASGGLIQYCALWDVKLLNYSYNCITKARQ